MNRPAAGRARPSPPHKRRRSVISFLACTETSPYTEPASHAGTLGPTNHPEGTRTNSVRNEVHLAATSGGKLNSFEDFKRFVACSNYFSAAYTPESLLINESLSFVASILKRALSSLHHLPSPWHTSRTSQMFALSAYCRRDLGAGHGLCKIRYCKKGGAQKTLCFCQCSIKPPRKRKH